MLLSRLLPLLGVATAFQVLIEDADETRQVCSGMFGPRGDESASIEVLFAPGGTGALALVIYEYNDSQYLGVQPTDSEDEEDRVFICDIPAVDAELCEESQLGKFIVTATEEDKLSIYTTTVILNGVTKSSPVAYQVSKTGYYCVGAVPLTTEGVEGTDDVQYTGVVDFRNVFVGHLPAAEYPKILFYEALAVIYFGLALGWLFLCFQNRADILTIQHYISATAVFLVVEMLAIASYYRYLNSGGNERIARGLLILVAVLNAARNSVSLFLLLLVSMGYGIVKESIASRVMLKIRLLTAVHFVFGVLYSLGTVSIPLDNAGFFLFFFVLPLALSLTSYMMWIMSSLFFLIADLDSRRQTFKQLMFTRLYRILLFAVMVIATFFVISTLSFSSRRSASYGAETWRTRWILLDGWLATLYLLVFASIAFLWRPSANNKRLAMSSELATDEAEADQYDVDALEREHDKDAIPLRGVNENVVFDLGESDEEDERGAGSGRAEERRLRGDDVDEESPPSYQKRRD